MTCLVPDAETEVHDHVSKKSDVLKIQCNKNLGVAESNINYSKIRLNKFGILDFPFLVFVIFLDFILFEFLNLRLFELSSF